MSELMVLRPPGNVLCTCCGFVLTHVRAPMKGVRYVDMWCTTEQCEHQGITVRVPFTTVACEIIE